MRLKLTVILTALAVAVASAIPTLSATGVSAQESEDSSDGQTSYIVLMDLDPVLEYEGGVDDLARTKPEDGDRPDPKSRAVRQYRKYLNQQQNETVEAVDLKPTNIINRFHYATVGFSVLLTEREAEEMRRQDDVVSVERDVLYQLDTDASPEYLGISEPGGAWDTGYTGENVVVGVIDTGIWPEHPSFTDDGTFDAPPDEWTGDACDFGDTAYNPDDVGFECNNKLIGARDMRATYIALIGAEVYNSARDYNGHGTGTAGTAAGNADVTASVFGQDLGTASGIAPGAHLAAYSACGDLGCYGSDLTAAIDQAVADGVDVINYSIGGGAAALTAAGLAFLAGNAAGVSVATSAGNSGPGDATVGSPGTDPWITTVGANTHDRSFSGAVTVGDETYTGASITAGSEELLLIDAADRGNELCDPAVQFEPAMEGEMVLCARGAVARIAKSQAVSEQGGGAMILYNQNDTQELVTDSHWVPSVHVTFTDGNAIKAAIATAEGDLTATIEALGAEPTPGSVMAGFSSRGPNPITGNILKPDVTAPGVNILAGSTPTSSPGPGGELFQSISGTSMSSPHVAGLMALMTQAHPGWSPAAIKSALMTTARQDVVREDGTTPADAFDMGAGHIDPSGDASAPGSLFNPGIVFDAGLADYVAYLCDIAPDFVGGDACDTVEGAGYPLAAEELNQASVAVGEVAASSSVSRTVTNVSDKALNLTPTIESPPGTEIEVSPTRLTIARGRTASFEVTITTLADATIDEWSFGSITWAEFSRGQGERGVSAYMPVVVRPVALAIPPEAIDEGAEGELSFDLRFGYGGEYQAAAHGLAAPETISGIATQDTTPEGGSPVFDPSDGGQGATTHEIELSGATYTRLSLGTENLTVPDGTPATDVDLDLFLYDSEGNQVAGSTAGGTNELLDLTLPEDDTYTLYVHGWATAGADEIGYDVQTWTVPDTTDGSLLIVEAPTEATLGEEGTVTVTWSGADTAVTSLGVVNHTGPDGIIGLTLVEIQPTG